MKRESLNVLVVDDETPIREWIAASLRDHPSVRLIESARNGEEALQRIQARPFDLVLTDITMPRLNGLDLLARIKAAHPGTSVVIMSVHNDFGHARSALKNGAVDYILKNEITRESLLALLDKLASAGVAEPVKKPERTHVDSIIRSQFLQRLMLEEQPPLSEELLRKNKIELEDRPLFACALALLPDSLEGIEQEFGSRLRNVTYFTYGKSYVLILANCDADRDWLSALAQMIAMLAGSPIGVSRLYPGLSGLVAAVREALQACKRLFYAPGGGAALPEYSEEEEKQIVRTLERTLDQAVEHYRQHRFDKAVEQINQSLELIEEKRLADIDYLKGMLVMTSHRLSLGSPQLQIDTKALEVSIQLAKTLSDLNATLRPLLEAMAACDVFSPPIAQAIEYISLNFGRSLSLSEVAEQAHLNEEYFSRLFKKEVGTNFTDYLLNLRMEKARTLLLSTPDKISYIAEKVGIADSKYFSLLYRKTFAQTPSQTRERPSRSIFSNSTSKK